MNTSSQIENLVEKSSIIFRGTVEKLKAATLRTIPVTDSTVVVKVDEVLKAAKTLGDLTGDSVTVQLSEPRPIKLRQQAIFFTIGLVYAESIVVQEVGRLEVAKGTKSQRAQVAEVAAAVRALPDRHVQRRSMSADLVVTGRVSAVRRARLREGHLRSRHHPDWHEATIDIESVESGSFSAKKIIVVFPASGGVLYRHIPKFVVGQEGLWILHKRELKELQEQVYLVLDPLDFHPKEQRDRIRTLIKRR